MQVTVRKSRRKMGKSYRKTTKIKKLRRMHRKRMKR